MQFHIEGMTCGGGARSVTKAIAGLDQHAKVTADPASRTVEVETTATPDAIVKVLSDVGYPATAR